MERKPKIISRPRIVGGQSDSKKVENSEKVTKKANLNLSPRPVNKISEVNRRHQSPTSEKQFSIKSASFTKVGHNPDNPNKPNQDSFFVIHNFLDLPHCHIFGVCDGHGQFGKEISEFIKDRLPFLLSNSRNFIGNPSQAIESAALILQSEIAKKRYDTTFSGSTLNFVLILGQKLYCANIGDSRAILGKKDKRWTAIALSTDHKPDIPEEKKRIEASGGRVEAYLGEDGKPYGPTRVWVKKSDYPGIAISRTLGDTLANSIGVIAVPEITEREINPADKLIVIGSDGLFEFINNEEMIRLASLHIKNKDPNAICAYLCRMAEEKWRMEEETVDDITCVCVLLEMD